jgi:uncharacterized membrane-anchored protein
MPLLATTAGAQEAPLDWQPGPLLAAVGDDLAEIRIGEDYVFLDAENTRHLMERLENPVSGTELGTVLPRAEESNWFIVFEFDEIGYVPDDEKDELDADAILKSIREGTEHANREREERGWSTMQIVGWHESPHYDARTHNLSWAVIGEGAEGRTINRIVKLLGRRGVMTATLVASPEDLLGAIPETDALLADYRFRSGSRYAEFVRGSDKLAEYGLTALVVGGGAAALVKSGLLARLWKPIAAAMVALGAGIRRMFMSGRSSSHDPQQPIT